jgi:PAS domain S-box-containing protein
MFGLKWQLHRKILDNVMNGVYLVDLNQKIQFWNSAAEKITGRGAGQMVGTAFDDKVISYADGRGNPLQLFEYPVTICLQEKRPVSKNLVMTAKDSLELPVEETASPLYENGKLVGVVATFRDISNCIRSVDSRLKSERKERLIPICGWCKKIRSDDDYWEQLETYLTNEGFGIFTHGMCPSCADKIFEKKIYLESYQDICKSISASISLDEVLQLIVTNVVKVMNVKASLLRLLNKETKQLEIASYYGLSEKYANKGPVGYDASIDDALAGKSVSVYDIAEQKGSKYYKEASEEGIRSILSIPMRSEKEVIGVLRMYTTEPVNYTDEDLQFISAIAEQGAIAIVNARRFETAVSNEKEYLEVFQEVTKALSVSLHPREVLEMIVRKIPEVMNLKAATVRLLDPDGKKLELVASYGLSEKYLNKGPVDAEKNVVEALKEKAVAIYDATTDNKIQYKKEAAEEGIKSMLTLPIVARGKLLGILRLLTSEHREFSVQEIDFVELLAEQSGIAIINAQHFEKEISKERQYLEVFQDVTKAVSVSLRPKDVLNMIVRKIPEVMILKAATIRLLDPSGEKLRLVAAHGLSDTYLSRGPVDTEDNVIAALNENPVAICDVATDDRITYKQATKEEGIKSMLTLPVMARGKVLGILRLLTGEPREFSQQEIDFAASLADQCGVAIENAMMYERTKKDYDDIMKDLDNALLDKE